MPGLRLGIFPPVLTAAIGVLTTLFPCGGVLTNGNGDVSGWAWVGERGWSRFGSKGGSGFGLSVHAWVSRGKEFSTCGCLCVVLDGVVVTLHAGVSGEGGGTGVVHVASMVFSCSMLFFLADLSCLLASRFRFLNCLLVCTGPGLDSISPALKRRDTKSGS